MEHIKKLFELLKSNKWAEVINILDKIDNDNNEIDVNIRDNSNNYLLTYAVLYNRLDIVTKLVEKGARIDILDMDGRSIIYIAIKYEYSELLKKMLEINKTNIGLSVIDIRDKNDNIPLHYALATKNADILKLLLDYGSNVNSVDANGYNSLHLAVYTRTFELCKLILDKDININARCNTGETALHLACNFQLADVVMLLIKNKINVDIQDFDHEYSALHYSVNFNDKQVVAILLKNMANPNIQDIYGNTPLHYSIIENTIECFAQLINSKYTSDTIDVNLQNIDGYIPLHLGLKNYIKDPTSNNNMEYVDLLIEKSNLNYQDNNGNTCLHYLTQVNNKLWKKYIVQLGKKKLDIFVKNKKNIRPIDNIPPDDINEFINLITQSYLYIIKQVTVTPIPKPESDKDNTIWNENWENLCKSNAVLDDLLPEEKKQLQDYQNKNKNKNNKDTLCESMIKSKLLNIIKNPSLYDKSCKNKSYPVNKNKSCIEVEEGVNVDVCTFIGSTIDMVIGLIYLLKKYPNCCSTLTKDFVESTSDCFNNSTIISNNRCEFLNFELIWTNQKIHFPSDFKQNFMACVEKKRFVILPLGIEMRQGSHSNYLIYDNKLDEIERFEPNGIDSPYGLNYNSILLDNILEKKFKDMKASIKYIRPKNFLPKIGFQMFDIYEQNKKKIGDPTGFCALWSMWYVDQRLRYEDVSRYDLIKNIIRNIKSQNISFKNMVRNYSADIVKLRDQVLSKANISINDWKNDSYNEKEIGIIINEIKKMILSIKK
jgi:ankyrin repeat protein